MVDNHVHHHVEGSGSFRGYKKNLSASLTPQLSSTLHTSCVATRRDVFVQEDIFIFLEFVAVARKKL